MFSDLFYQLVEQGVLVRGIWETVYMTVLSALFAYLIGLPLGMILAVTDEGGIRPVCWGWSSTSSAASPVSSSWWL